MSGTKQIINAAIEKDIDSKEKINALLIYANTKTGANNTNIGDAIKSLVEKKISIIPADKTGEAIENTYLDGEVEKTYNGWKISPYYKVGNMYTIVSCDGGANTVINHLYTAVYNADFSFIGTLKHNIAYMSLFSSNELPQGAAFIRVSASNSAINNTTCYVIE